VDHKFSSISEINDGDEIL